MSGHSTPLSAGSLTSGDDYQPKSRYFPLKKPPHDYHYPPSHHSSSSLNCTTATSSLEQDHSLDVTISPKHYTKLEVIDARQISVLLRWYAAGIALGAAVTIILLILIHTKFKIVPFENFPVTAPTPLYGIIITIFKIPLILGVIILLTFYATRVGRLPKCDRTHQQVWVIVLLVSVILYLNPYFDIVNILDYLKLVDVENRNWPGSNFMQEFFPSLRHAAFTVASIFYMWASVHSYGMLEKKMGLRFYALKIILILGYLVIHLILLIGYKIRTAELPLTSVLSMVAAFEIRSPPDAIKNVQGIAGEKSRTTAIVCVGLMTAYEVFLLILIIYQIAVTKKRLANVDYLKYRTNQIGFRFFLYDSLNFYVVFWIFHVIALLALPPGLRVTTNALSGELLLSFQENVLGLEILLVVYAALETYVNLPADAVGFLGWIHPQSKPGNVKPAPITYRKLEPVSEGKCHPLDLQMNCFTMQTHVEMFNFAWLVYYHGTPKYAGLKQTPGLFSYKIEGHVHNDDTDSHALVINGSDRIVVAFKGTSSVRNLRTDLNSFHVNCSKVIPTKLPEDDFESRDLEVQKTLASNDFLSAKLHKGFAHAYMSISKKVMKLVKALHDKRKRPIYLTGHSLGGALSAIASLDIYLKMGLGPNDIFVSSFGAPRVGNSSFRKLYNAHIPHHWRIVISPDIVAKLPKMGYQHVGKKVLLTAAGELFIDPNALEMKHWHGDPLSLLYHRKASYLLAMKAWCRKHHRETYEPHFWPFPYRDDDSRRFPTAVGRHPSSGKDRNREGRKRIMTLDAMVDALDRKKRADVAEYALANWARLTRRALLNEEFRLRFAQ